MGGLFGLGKNKDKGGERKPLPEKAGSEDPQATRKSRKIIAAGARPGAGANRPGPGPRTVPAGRSAEANPPMELAPTGVNASTPSIDLPLELGEAPRQPSGPVVLEDAPAPSFGGTIASGSRSGPSRTGDATMLEFLQKKANPPLLTVEQAGQARGLAEAEGIAIDAACVRLAFFTEDQLVTVLTQECWVPHLKVDKYEIRKKALDTVTREDAIHYGVFPVDKLGSLLTLAMVNPLDTEAIRSLEHKTGLDIKKVVATRSEITQGIEKYYSGNLQAKDASRSFVQDVEPRSVTQMMSKVGPSGPAQAPLIPAPAPSPATESIVADILDIDDLLGAEIAPAIIEPILAEPMTMEEEPALVGRTSAPTPLPSLDLEPSPGTDTETVMTPDARTETSALVPNRPLAPAFPTLDMELAPAAETPAAPTPAAALPPISAAVAPVVPVARPAAPVARPAAAPVAHPAPPSMGANKPAGATSRFQAGSAAGTSASALVQVTEDEFRYAISHGRSRLFERWVALQTRNRIINGQPVERELEPVLAGLFTFGRRS